MKLSAEGHVAGAGFELREHMLNHPALLLSSCAGLCMKRKSLENSDCAVLRKGREVLGI